MNEIIDYSQSQLAKKYSTIQFDPIDEELLNCLIISIQDPKNRSYKQEKTPTIKLIDPDRIQFYIDDVILENRSVVESFPDEAFMRGERIALYSCRCYMDNIIEDFSKVGFDIKKIYGPVSENQLLSILIRIYELNIKVMIDISIFYMMAYVSLSYQNIIQDNYLFALSLLSKNTRLNRERFNIVLARGSKQFLKIQQTSDCPAVEYTRKTHEQHYYNLLINPGIVFFTQYNYIRLSRPENAYLEILSVYYELLKYKPDKDVVVPPGQELYYMRILWAIREITDYMGLVAISEGVNYLEANDEYFERLKQLYKVNGMVINSKSRMIYGFSEPLWQYVTNRESLRVARIIELRNMLRKVAFDCFSRIVIPRTKRRLSPHLIRILVNYF